ncbi:transposase [Planosporangium mesophilum]|uniref:Transposase n=1 Tax=Planosporangium mesophilum TaxID=689768 RepID=A0A8J3TCC7_9ACTN|nr:transposase [Planosporangium mesophilum]NJC83128.1 transposase [Planosporangium mesophilum]GII22542.1 transposase [Planosporangium mesophilum]
MARQGKYPEESRRQAAALVLDSGRTIRDVGRELGVNHETLRNWVDELRAERTGGPAAAGLSSDERAELVRLRRQVV